MNAVAIPVDDETIASPCINVCKMNERTGLCEGCRRSLDEIACWSLYSAAEKRAVLEQLPARKQTP
jgi:predicted Fe-S protein YdhL (DUF1289 family)